MQSIRQRLIPPLWIVSIAGLGVIGWLVYELKELVTLLIIGFSFAYIIDPVLARLEARGVRREIGTIAIFSLVVIALITITITVLPVLTREYTALRSNLPTYLTTARERSIPLLELAVTYFPGAQRFIDNPKDIFDIVPAPSEKTINTIIGGVWSTLVGGYSFTLALVNLLLLPFIVFYLAVDFRRLDDVFLKLFPILMRDKVRSVMEEIDSYVSAFVRGQITIGLILTLLYSIGLGVIGVDLWFLIAVVSGLGNMIPYLGTITGIALGSVMALVTFGDFFHLALVWGVYALVQVLEGNFITPKVLGDEVGLSPLAIILSLLAGGTLFGLLGVILAVPGIAAMRVLLAHWYRWYLQEGGVS